MIFKRNKIFKKYFSDKKINFIDIPNLIDIQLKSYENFLQKNVNSLDKIKNTGLQSVFKSVFPIRDYSGRIIFEYVKYNIGVPKYDVVECKLRGITYCAPVKVLLKLNVYEKDEDIIKNKKENKNKSFPFNILKKNVSSNVNKNIISYIKEQEIYLGDIPLMTDRCTFIINGSERVIVSQLHKSPGVFFSVDRKIKNNKIGKITYKAKIVPYRGSWLDIEFDYKDNIFCRIDRGKKFLVSILLKSMGYTIEDILKYFYRLEKIIFIENEYKRQINIEDFVGYKSTFPILDDDNEKILYKKNTRITKKISDSLKNRKILTLSILESELNKIISLEDIFDITTGNIILKSNECLSAEKLIILNKNKITELNTVYVDRFSSGSYLRNIMIADRIDTQEEAVVEIYKILRYNENVTIDIAENYFYNLFFNIERYDLTEVGRIKINQKLSLNTSILKHTLTKDDILKTIEYLLNLKVGIGTVDDIDNLGNRRVRSVGELIENQYRIGLVKLERNVKDKINNNDISELSPGDLINNKQISSTLREFFGSSQLSQFMDQTNPLSEITHKRRLSSLGPGGLTRERAGFEVRDVHHTHYCRICPIETPEGPNIGLISSLAIYSRINKYGLIETPYKIVKNSIILNDIVYLNAIQEENQYIARFDTFVNSESKIIDEFSHVRYNGEFSIVKSSYVNYIETTSGQMISVAAGLIPFLVHVDANRALMGSNMQRQAVPLLIPELPLIGTGLEKNVSFDSRLCCIAERSGRVVYVDSNTIIIKVVDSELNDFDYNLDIYRLEKYQKSNQNTCYNQKPIVSFGDLITKNEVIADGPSMKNGELALGVNLLSAFMPWQGYNFEDSILINERLVKEDIFTSLHIEEYECVARETKLGSEEFTKNIPNINDESLVCLSEEGIIKIGSYVKPGDILVGRITPKDESILTPEEKLLKAIFGEKTAEGKDTSLRVGTNSCGVVINSRVFYGKNKTENIENTDNLNIESELYKKDLENKLKVLDNIYLNMFVKILDKEKVFLNNELDNEIILNKELIIKIGIKNFSLIKLIDNNKFSKFNKVFFSYERQYKSILNYYNNKINKLKESCELPFDTIKIAKITIIVKRKLQPGDKMSGRHGNKGVVSKVLASEDMPYLSDGTPLDVVLNPLGVPSRMNVGQVFETNLGMLSRLMGLEFYFDYIKNLNIEKTKKNLIFFFDNNTEYEEFINKMTDYEFINYINEIKSGIPIVSPVFNSVKEEFIKKEFKRFNISVSGQVDLFDGRTGEKFHNKVTVGIMYMLKLNHLVDDKIHARSVGPYSLVTQQPLGGKAQFGGQRLGEMEVWAIEAYGASNILREFLTVKSDDIIGRIKIYESIVKGNNILCTGIPETFNVLVKELQALSLDVNLNFKVFE